MAEKTPGQIMYEAQGCAWSWEVIEPQCKELCERAAAAVIAHVRPQIEREARACAVEDAISAMSGGWAGEKLAEKLRALATLPSGFVVIGKDEEPTLVMLDAGHDEIVSGRSKNFPTQRAVNVFKAMLALAEEQVKAERERCAKVCMEYTELSYDEWNAKYGHETPLVQAIENLKD